MEKNVLVSLLLDIYGALLTERQRQALLMHYDEDLSLGEIAELTGISRQGVRDNINRAEQLLQKYEKTLGLLEKDRKQKELLSEIITLVKINESSDNIIEKLKKLNKTLED